MRYKAMLWIEVSDEHGWDEEGLKDVLTEELNHMGDVSVDCFVMEEPAGCDVHMLSSRACEKGTKSCVVKHEPLQEKKICHVCGGTRCM